MSLLVSPLHSFAEHLGLSPESEWLAQALTHSSYAAEHDCVSNERLEFLGDAVVDLAVADLIFTAYPALNEGSGSLVRSRVVNESALAGAARHLELAKYVRVGRGEVKSRGLERASLLADAFEAVVAAVFLERGYESAKRFVADQLGAVVAEAALAPDDVDPKTRLRQWCESSGLGTPVYEVHAEGPAHATTFRATVAIGGEVRGAGHGSSKKIAETQAARDAWEVRDDA
ncbi:MAG TPA: ribonuclease III [Acidimicrobiales bacterium]|nr:ribonuclease III [Acidimicrobiales bacterium]